MYIKAECNIDLSHGPVYLYGVKFLLEINSSGVYVFVRDGIRRSFGHANIYGDERPFRVKVHVWVQVDGYHGGEQPCTQPI